MRRNQIIFTRDQLNFEGGVIHKNVRRATEFCGGGGPQKVEHRTANCNKARACSSGFWKITVPQKKSLSRSIFFKYGEIQACYKGEDFHMAAPRNEGRTTHCRGVQKTSCCRTKRAVRLHVCQPLDDTAARKHKRARHKPCDVHANGGSTRPLKTKVKEGGGGGAPHPCFAQPLHSIKHATECDVCISGPYR
jgi:hypothetical protein